MGKEFVVSGAGQGTVQDASGPQTNLDLRTEFREESGNSSTMTEARPEDKRYRRPLFIMGGLVLLLFGVLAYVLLFHDGPPPEDAHLMPTWSERGGNSNPLAVFCKTLMRSSIKDWEKLLDESRKLDESPTPEARKFVATHTAEIAAFETLMTTEPSSWQWPDAADMARSKSPFSDGGTSECQMLSSVLRSKACQLCEDGKREEAAALCLKIARWADGMCGAEGATIHLLTAGYILNGALHTLQKVLQADGVRPVVVRDALQQLRALKGPQMEQYKKAMKVDYAWMKDGTGKLSRGDLKSIGSLPKALQFLAPRYFKRNQTLTLRVQLDAPLMSALDQGWKSACRAMDAREAKVGDMHGPKSLACFLDPNFIGRSSAFYFLALPRTGYYWNFHAQHMLLLALRLHELEHGHLPATLDAVAPAYLPAVPTDVASGTPFLWNAKLQVLYTVGKNGKDDGGLIEERPQKGLDWGVKYPWGASGIKPTP